MTDAADLFEETKRGPGDAGVVAAAMVSAGMVSAAVVSPDPSNEAAGGGAIKPAFAIPPAPYSDQFGNLKQNGVNRWSVQDR